MIYLDTSALVKLVWAEEHSAELVPWLSRCPDESYVSSTLADVELRRTVWRVDAGAMEYAQSVLDELTLLPIDAAVVRAAGRFHHPSLRALDAIHLATALGALRLGDVSHFVTYDKRLFQAAVAEGLSTAAPGT